jgi:ubiquinone/menaquinone biosynthesis C-methylase UbiE
VGDVRGETSADMAAGPGPEREAYSVGYDAATAEFFRGRTAAAHAAFLLPHLGQGMTVLDGACGPRTITAGLAAVVSPGGVDVDPGQIDLTRAHAAASLYALPFPGGSFDAVFLHGVLEHLRGPVAALREARRVLKHGGVVGARHADFGGFLLEPAHRPSTGSPRSSSG